MADIKDQIRKILNIANDDAASEAEVENALAIAARLMDKHHLSEDDLAVDPLEQSQDIRNAPRGTAEAYGTDRMTTWEKYLGTVVCKIVGGIACYSHPGRVKTTPSGLTVWNDAGHSVKTCPLVFYGIAEDCAIAVRLWGELRHAIIALARLRFGGVFRGDGAAYAEGFVTGLNTKAIERETQERQAAQRLVRSDGTGRTAFTLLDRRADLIRQKSDLARQWIASPAGGSLKIGNKSGGGSRGSRDAREQGRSDGGQYNVNAARSKKLC